MGNLVAAATPDTTTTPETFGQVQNFTLDFIQSLDVADGSKKTYQRGLSQFTSWLESNHILNPVRQDILAYKAFLSAKRLSAFTVSNYIIALKLFFEWTETTHLYPNISKNIKCSKKKKGFQKDPLTLEQIKSLLESFDRATLEGKRNFAIVNLMLRTALRSVEVVRCNYENLRQVSGQPVLYVQGKGRDVADEFVILTSATLRPIREYLSARGCINDGDPLFASSGRRNTGGRLTTFTVSKMLKKHLRQVGLDDRRLTCHSMRHTAITLSLVGGASLQQTSGFARHSSIDTTMVYAHNIDRVSETCPERKIDAVLAGVLNA